MDVKTKRMNKLYNCFLINKKISIILINREKKITIMPVNPSFICMIHFANGRNSEAYVKKCSIQYQLNFFSRLSKSYIETLKMYD